jgi:hypothetical protein
MQELHPASDLTHFLPFPRFPRSGRSRKRGKEWKAENDKRAPPIDENKGDGKPFVFGFGLANGEMRRRIPH